MGKEYLEELENELRASRACLERIPGELFEYKPHERSMQMGYLASIIAEIPRWIAVSVTDGVIDFQTFNHPKLETTEALVKYFDDNMELARAALGTVSDETLAGAFTLKNGEQILATDTIKNTVSSSINHSVHHRGQLTVYMRLNNIAVPHIYGPSADDKTF
ncbi:MAG TPA: DinB family protein [Candidatus Paceibacterota bacterium]|jgi:uncharacterized damage-inducible protein DinB|nr:DinB family protein [Candidatus Paceibacterota bacterium]